MGNYWLIHDFCHGTCCLPYFWNHYCWGVKVTKIPWCREEAMTFHGWIERKRDFSGEIWADALSLDLRFCLVYRTNLLFWGWGEWWWKEGSVDLALILRTPSGCQWKTNIWVVIFHERADQWDFSTIWLLKWLLYKGISKWGVQMLMICNGNGIADFIVDKPKKKP